MNRFLRHFARKFAGLQGTQRKHPILRKRMNPMVPHLHHVKAKGTPDPLKTAVRNSFKGKYPTNSVTGVIKRAIRIRKPRDRRLNKQKIY